MSPPTAPKQLRVEAFEALKQRRDAAAADLLSRYLDAVPTDTEAELALAVARSGQGKHAAALAIFDRLLERQPQSPVLHFNRGMTLDRLGRKIDAVQSYELVMRLNPNHAKARQRLDVLCGTATSGDSPKNAIEYDDSPVVIAVDESEDVGGRHRRANNRYISPMGLAALGVYAAMPVGAAFYWLGAYAAGQVFVGLILSNIFFLLGLQTIHRARRRQQGSIVGMVLGVIGVCGLIAAPVTRLSPAAVTGAVTRVRSAAPKQWADFTPEDDGQAQQRTAKAREDAAAKAVTRALEKIKSDDPQQVASGCATLVGIKPNVRRKEVGAALEGLLEHKDWTVRYWSATALTTWGSRDAIAKLKPLLTDRNNGVRAKAKETIQALERQPQDVGEEAP